ncbi:MAG TPA: alpha/beta fold hydrolase [Nitrososphaeraceae archaeon]|nr:alpha/beta fold hydrolase [Nitrososphaeraceae archaeon]
MKLLGVLSLILFLYSISFLIYGNNFTLNAQSDLRTTKHRDIVIDLGNKIKTNAQLTLPDIGKGPFPGVLLITGSGAEDMNETAGFIRIDNKTGDRTYPPVPFFQIADYLSERGFTVLRYDKRGIGTNHTILDSNIWGNLTLDDITQDANKALAVLIHQSEVDPKRINIIGHSEGTMIAPRVAMDNPDKVDNIVLMGAVDNQSKILEFQTVALPLLYAKEVLDKNHDGTLSVLEASRDITFERLVGGNLSLILTQNVENGTKTPKVEYNANNDTHINIESELKPVLVNHSKSLFAPSKSAPSETSGKCTNLEGCPMYSSSFLKFEPNLSNIGSVPTNTSILILNGENDTQTPVQGALVLRQKLTELRHPDHILITYPNLGHEFYPSTQWLTQNGPIEQYVLRDLYSWLEAHSGLTSLSTR